MTDSRAAFRVEKLGRYRYTVVAWVDRLLSWRREFARRVEAADILLAGQGRCRAGRANGTARARSRRRSAQSLGRAVARGTRSRVARGRSRWTRRRGLSPSAIPIAPWRREYARELEVAGRSAAGSLFGVVRVLSPLMLAGSGRHGTFARLRSTARLCRAARFRHRLSAADPPHRRRSTGKAPTTNLRRAHSDPGSPWAIGSTAGGHKAIHPELGTLEDFRRFVAQARDAKAEGGARRGVPGRARSPLRRGASGMVSLASGRHCAVCREPAQEVSGHLSVQLRVGGLGAACGRN